MDLALLAKLPPEQVRLVLPAFVSGYLSDAAARAVNHDRVTKHINGWSDDTIRALMTRLVELGEEPRTYLADPAGRALSRVWTTDILPEAAVVGLDSLLAAMARGPTLIACNHSSYFDSTAIDTALAWAGHPDAADRVLSVAGPKVYESLFRRLASACLNTLPVPQSTSLGHTAQLSPRELAKRALASIEAAESAVNDGMVLLLYPEGSRTRTGRLRSFLRGAHRYLTLPNLRIVPAALDGTQQVMPVGSEKLATAPIRLSFGPAIDPATVAGNRDELVAAVHRAVADLLPDALKPDASDPPVA